MKYDGEFSTAPLEQKDLDKLVEKKLGDVRKEGFRCSHYFNEDPDFITFELENGYFKYGIETDTYEYRDNQEQRNYDDLIIKSVNWYGGFSNEAYGPDFNRE